MRLPARLVVGQLVWTHGGSVWALWRVGPVSYPYLDRQAKLDLHARTRSALLSLPAESMLLGLCQRIDAADVVERMIAGLDLDRCPAWAEAATVALDGLCDSDLFERAWFVAARLPDASPRASVAAALAAGRAQVAGRFGLRRLLPPSAEVERRRRQATQIGELLSSSVDLRAATAAEVCWIYARAARRGLAEPTVDQFADRGEEIGTAALVGLGDALFLEGGSADDEGRPRLRRRFLRVDTEGGSSYQALMVVAAMPHRFAFPGGGEWLAAVDRFACPIDWCVRVRPVTNAEAQVRATRQARQLLGQVDEYAGEPAGAPTTLTEAMEGIEDERAALAANPADPELEVTTMLCVWADNLVELEERAEAVRTAYQLDEFRLPRPIGGQLALYGAMLPAAPSPAVARDYTQFLLPRDLAAAMPFAGSEVGDPTGMLLGVSLDTGIARPVLLDPAFGPAHQRSGSLAAVGDPGSGKSHLVKCLAWATLARGGQVVALDRTPRGEWVDFASVAPGHPQVVRLADDAEVCLDPLRVFEGTDRVTIAIGFLSLLTQTAPADLEGAALAQAVRAVAARDGGRLSDVVDELATRRHVDPAADVVGRKLAHLVQERLAGLVFGDGPLLELAGADCIVFHAPGLSLPDREVLLQPHLARQLLGEHLLSQALVYLLTAVARNVAFADHRRFAAVLIDEAWALTASLEGRQLVIAALKDGRKHNAAMWLVSQDPDDLGDEAVRDLLRIRLVFRQARAAARRSLEFLGIKPEEPLVALVESGLRTGRCLLRDVRDRIGQVEVFGAPLPELVAAFDTNPGATRDASGDDA